MNPFDTFASGLSSETVTAVRQATTKVSDARAGTLGQVFSDLDVARHHAAAVKAHVLDNLGHYLRRLESRCTENGVRVHWAPTAAEAAQIIVDVCDGISPACRVVKAKSMATEEIGLNHALESAGHQVVETDLGEFVIQLDEDTPSHIVAPIIHKDRGQVADSFVRHGLGPRTEVPEELALQARRHLRQCFQRADVGISGVNFAIAESGRLVIVENEGNNRLSTTAPRVHIAVMGLEKLLPDESHLPLFLRLLAGSATGQRLTVYTHFVHGPKRAGDLDGPDEVHLVIVDNGRSQLLSGPYRDILRCIRCGACLNHCPVYRQASGHAYGHVYSGPLGAVLAPAKDTVEAWGHLAKASTLCGLCEEVCPVAIPIPDMLLQLRSESPQTGTLPWRTLRRLAANDKLWRASLPLLRLAVKGPRQWGAGRANPRPDGIDFRRWFDDRA